ncbi:AAA family ATPase [Aureivirga sp. CE67]|uniref:AAA family ATPase n=1 Tax=Aureivirga sp. CE67 TaxID=1788983 RepID=UPI0018CA92D5|nr:AAA family ATPase [Aureivirga sp. CE67]
MSNEKEQFKLLALQPLKGCSKEGLKALKIKDENEKTLVYYFSNDYIIDPEKGGIIKNPDYKVPTDFYSKNIDGINVSVSAIVGKNGSGKSSLIELLLMAINTFVKENNNIDWMNDTTTEGYLKVTSPINLYLFFISAESVYRLHIDTSGRDNKTLISKWGMRDKNWKNEKIVKLGNEEKAKEFNFQDFFYTALINYSHYGLNSSELKGKDWLTPLFHKNDGYQLPLVMMPYRKKGNIDINTEAYLTKSRMVSNLLLPSSEKEENKFRMLTPSLKAVKLKLTVSERLESKYVNGDGSNKFEINNDLLDSIIKEVLKIDKEESIRYKAITYLKYKITSIAEKYSIYNKYFSGKGLVDDEKKLKEYLNLLKKDTSHIALKFHQTVNYLTKGIYSEDDNIEIIIDVLSKEIIKKETDESKIINFVPPPIFDIDIELENINAKKEGEEKEIHFNTLSSGEKQQIFSINSILYHLRNLNSVIPNKEGVVSYKNVNLILDEIELYAHPEYQRKFLSDLLVSLSKLPLKSDNGGVKAINILFVTHSPFIISDILKSNILFLEDGEPYLKEMKNTFGANIHELLTNSFFMESTMGAFATKKIKEIVDFYYKVIMVEGKVDDFIKNEFKDVDHSDEDLEIASKKAQEKIKEFEFVCENIGEGLVKHTIKNHIDYIKQNINRLKND